MKTLTLFLTEKPSQAKEVAEALGITHKTNGVYRNENHIVSNALGHLLETAEPQAYGEQFSSWRLDTLPCIPNTWKLNVKNSGKAQFKILKGLIKEVSSVVIATDADREGEVIAREILDLVGFKGRIQRLWVQETTPSGYKKGLNHLKDGKAFESMYQSGLGRSHADWLSGMNLTRALTTAFSAGENVKGKGNVLHFGRVQTPTLALIVRRENAIAQFKSSDYYVIKALFNINHQAVEMTLKPIETWIDAHQRIVDPQIAQSIIAFCDQNLNRFAISEYETHEEQTPAPLPYYLGSLQKDCASLGLKPDRVLEICQTLYDTCKLISYPRTAGEYIPEQLFEETALRLNALKKIDPTISKYCEIADITNMPRSFNDEKVAKAGSHFALIPTDTSNFDLSTLKDDEFKVYDLIRRRYIAQFLGRYIDDKTVISAQCLKVKFSTTGYVAKSLGWKIILPRESRDEPKGESNALPNAQLGQAIVMTDTTIDLAKTKPPSRYNSGTLITAMESIDKEIKRRSFGEHHEVQRKSRHRNRRHA